MSRVPITLSSDQSSPTPATQMYANLPVRKSQLDSALPALATSFAEILCPVFKLLQPLFADAGTNVDQAGFKVLESDGLDLVHGRME